MEAEGDRVRFARDDSLGVVWFEREVRPTSQVGRTWVCFEGVASSRDDGERLVRRSQGIHAGARVPRRVAPGVSTLGCHDKRGR